MLTEPRALDEPIEAFLERHGTLFARFDHRTQDSGNVSYGVEAESLRYFVKTAGDPADSRPFLAHEQRVALLRNAVRLARSCTHPCRPALVNVLETPTGPALVYDWVPGMLVEAPRAGREEPGSTFRRFRALPLGRLLDAVGSILDVHRALDERGWIPCDFYDGAMIYDFDAHALFLVDLDHYRPGPSVNDMGRMFGSTRFMAPEEYELGARIDRRTAVFVLGRAMSVFLGDGTLERRAFRGSGRLHELMLRACRPGPDDRIQDVGELHRLWLERVGESD